MGRVDSQLSEAFVNVAEQIADRPEVAFEEYHARGLLSGWLAEHGFEIDDVDGLPTAFSARFGAGSPNVAILLEYDALPGVGHGCGHHLIGAGGALAAILASRRHAGTGSIIVLGCPAEESGAGKAYLIEAGAFDEVDAAMMFHPASTTVLARSAVAARTVSVEFFGRASHTARAPEHGRNALSSAIFLFNGIDALRARLGRWATISGFIAEGGVAVNIVPEYSRVELLLRDVSSAAVAGVLEQVEAIVRGAALAAGTTYKVTTAPHVYAERRNNRTMLKALAQAMRMNDLVINQPRTDESLGSSDIGNVSLVVPTIHPTLNVATEPTPSHTKEFEAVCRQPRAYAAAVSMASSLATLMLRILEDERLRSQIREEFEQGGYDAPGTDFADLAEA